MAERGGLLYARDFGHHIVRIAGASNARRRIFCDRILVEWLEFNIVLAEQVFILAETIQQLSLGEPALSPARVKRRRDARSPRPDAIGTRKLAVALDLALLAEHARKHPLWLRGRRERGSLLGRGPRSRHGCIQHWLATALLCEVFVLGRRREGCPWQVGCLGGL